MNPPRPSSASQAKACPDPVGVVRVTDLLKNRQVLVIEHAGERYLLRLTRNGKLILTK
ncbi:MAG TPA: hemin uptake protein HemP [Thiobacillaceae bacterium]|nr:hemin uptake protein HemP [Thiobacillaceae bacterium]HNF89758.1 hemin uptake protein HemP [Thiobacillaceae bacterium]HNI08152.1 hemin uptake protein HemP [Thiobacillaceae bacterium]